MIEEVSKIRSKLLSLTVVISYLVFTSFGIVLAKYEPRILDYTDLALIPLGLTIILIMYLFTYTYEKRKQYIFTPEIIEIIKLYGEGKSFEKIKQELGLKHIQEVKRAISLFCKESSK